MVAILYMYKYIKYLMDKKYLRSFFKRKLMKKDIHLSNA